MLHVTTVYNIQAIPFTHTKQRNYNTKQEFQEWKGIFAKKNQDDFTFYDQTVIHTQAVYVQKAQFYEVC